MNGINLAATLRRMALGIESEDSLEGSIEYHATDERDWYEVSGVYRVGNRFGDQGGVILISGGE